MLINKVDYLMLKLQQGCFKKRIIKRIYKLDILLLVGIHMMDLKYIVLILEVQPYFVISLWVDQVVVLFMDIVMLIIDKVWLSNKQRHFVLMLYHLLWREMVVQGVLLDWQILHKEVFRNNIILMSHFLINLHDRYFLIM